jgi:hypothetical protein
MKIPLNKVNPRLSCDTYSQSEKRDCVVRALANVMGVPYGTAHTFMKKHCNRKDTYGVKGSQIINLFKNKKDVIRRDFNAGIWEEKRFHTIGQLIKAKPTGTYYILVRGHATSVINGVLNDTVSKNWVIRHCWEILKK